MEEKQIQEQSFIKLHAVPKTHLFMKKITRIQAIDRQIRKKWIKIKRQNQKQNLTTIQEYSINPSKKSPIKQHTLIDFEPHKDIKKLSNLQNSLKRQKILNNHKRNEEIFYSKKDRSPYFRSLKNQHSISLNSSKQFISVDSSRKRTKTQSKPDNNSKQKVSPLSSIEKGNYRQSSEKNEQRRSTIFSNEAKKLTKLPFMLEKIKDNKKRQREALTCQSQKQLIELSTKNRHHMKEWASQRKDLYQKLKGSRAYYIMKSPTRLSEAQDVYIF